LQARHLLKKYDHLNVSLLANSENLAKNFSIIFNKKVHSIPMPGPDQQEIDQLINNHHSIISPNKNIKIGYFGHASLDKGGHYLSEIVSTVLKNTQGVEFHLHLSPNHEVEASFNEFKNTKSDRIIFYEGHLSKPKMIKLMSEVDIVLLPYSAKKYASCPSAVLMESLILKKVVVVPDASSLSDTVVLYDAGFKAFKQFHPEAIALALQEAIQHFEVLQHKSSLAGERYYQSNNIRKYTSDFLKLLNDEQAITKTAVGHI
jgi:glycosyltransferase involved in cell wall biosynthesis